MSHNASENSTEKGVAPDGAHGQSQGAYLNRNITPGGHPLDNSFPGFGTNHSGDPGPLGLSAFALTTFILSLVNLGAAGVKTPTVVVGPAIGYGGIVQLLAGMWEFASGNTFAATAFSSYGGFWISVGFILSPWSLIESSYAKPADFGHAFGFFLGGWFIFTFIMLFASLRSSVGLVGVFFNLTITFMLLAINQFVSMPAVGVAGGAFGIITAFNAWYVAAAGLLTPDTSYLLLPNKSLRKED